MYIYVRNMNIYHLKYFIDAARLNSVSRSAELNNVSHSAVSQSIGNLEQYFDVQLIYHAKRKFQLTPQGEQLLAEGMKILSSLTEVKEHLQSSVKEVRGDLILWAPQSLVVESLYRTLASYRKKYPKVRIQLKTGAAAQVRRSITTGEGHVGILIDDGNISEYSSVNVKSGNFVLATKGKHHSLEQGPVIITGKDKIEVIHLAKTYKSKYKTDIKFDMEVLSWGVIKNLIEKNFGIGYVPDYCVAQELQSQRLQAIPMPGKAFHYDIKAIWSSERQIHPNAKLFVSMLKEECAD